MKHYFYKLIGSICFFLLGQPYALSLSGASGEYDVGEGLVWSDAVNDTYRSATGWGYQTLMGQSCFAFNIRSADDNSIWNSASTTYTSSDGKYTGLKIAEDILFIVKDATVNTYGGGGDNGGATFNSYGKTTATGSAVIQNSPFTYCVTGTSYNSFPNPMGAGRSISFNGMVAIYVGPNAQPGKYSIPAFYAGLYMEPGIPLSSAGFITVKTRLSCSISTPPKIDFGKVNIWEWEGNTSGTPGGNRKDVLGSIDGNFTINCTGSADAHTPAKLTLNGTTQTYSNDLKMTMDATGEIAPATIRASIKSIYAPCHTSGINFGTGNLTPPANEVNLGELTVGQHLIPYRFSLCALGQGFKSGAASASATVTIDWE
ncbi:hypothetical protein [Providencia alcalifaciens]|uniref:hypothetical protein n=1 Tax=Providencia alcalifaciens TaxID=126385 RepID=UPI0012B5D073|nr:hypothetical protein [Providencia alcalifaciens]MTB34053.1 hypothetical protein [Providencia alcalifaciens]MTC99030.1 hypothetical protein [Providencia alcalifaciens]